ncbi:hypothetical protein D3C75_1369240 [compost metagenome]
MVKADVQFCLMAFQAHHGGAAHQAVDLPDAQAIAHRDLVNLLHVGEPPVGQDYAVSRDVVGFFE